MTEPQLFQALAGSMVFSAETRWRRTADESPDYGQTVVVYNKRWVDPVWLGYLDSKLGWEEIDGMPMKQAPSHWAPLPEKPSEMEASS